MPSWGIHLEVGNLISKKLVKINKNQFMIGNVLPDINNGFVLEKISEKIEHRITHFDKRDDYKNYEKFYYKYEKYLNNPVILGYITHLLTDYYYNDLAYSKKGIFDEKGNLIGVYLNSGKEKICIKEELRQLKVKDFKIFADYIYKKQELDELYFDEEILNSSKIIKEIHITKEDLLETINYLNSHIHRKTKIKIDNIKYNIFTQEELINETQLCVDFIINYLRINK